MWAREVLRCFLFLDHLPTQEPIAISQYLACFYQPFSYYRPTVPWGLFQNWENQKTKKAWFKSSCTWFFSPQTTAWGPDAAAAYVHMAHHIFRGFLKRWSMWHRDYKAWNGNSHQGAGETNPTRNHVVAGSIPGLAWWVKDLAWLWCRLAATAQIRLLAWEPPYATDAALKRPNKNKKKIFKSCFYSRTCSIWKFPCQGSNWSCCCQPTPQPQPWHLMATMLAS